MTSLLASLTSMRRDIKSFATSMSPSFWLVTMCSAVRPNWVKKISGKRRRDNVKRNFHTHNIFSTNSRGIVLQQLGDRTNVDLFPHLSCCWPPINKNTHHSMKGRWAHWIMEFLGPFFLQQLFHSSIVGKGKCGFSSPCFQRRFSPILQQQPTHVRVIPINGTGVFLRCQNFPKKKTCEVESSPICRAHSQQPLRKRIKKCARISLKKKEPAIRSARASSVRPSHAAMCNGEALSFTHKMFVSFQKKRADLVPRVDVWHLNFTRVSFTHLVRFILLILRFQLLFLFVFRVLKIFGLAVTMSRTRPDLLTRVNKKNFLKRKFL